MGIGRKATDQRTPCRKFLSTPLRSMRKTRSFHLGQYPRGVGTKVPQGGPGAKLRWRSEGRSPPEAEAICIHCLQMFTGE